MAQETKVGLVVGLGFIVCFAVTLSNRHGAEHIQPQMPYRLFGTPTESGQSPTGILPENRAREIGRGQWSTTVAREPAERSAPASRRSESVAPRRDRVGSEPGIIADPERFTRRRRPIPQPLDLPGAVLADAADARQDHLDLLVGEAPRYGQPQTHPDGTASAKLPSSLAAYADLFEPATPRHRAAPIREEQHVVRKGDTLTKIARRYYGSSSPGIVTAIFEANRQVMRSPHEVVEGSRLRLPMVEGVSPPDEPAAGADLRQAQADALRDTRRAPAYRWYKVQKGDLLGTIAQKQLGTSRRWKEIFELNRDICPDARHLPCGVEIRIPIDTLADSR
ncbi:MAG: LysM peptidoglycan-binding domain-containing protein [Phycisphaerae bacterium]|nr:LysM peptidoglycan-binding domain-containing protein [Phycisphaerae bacterium]